MSFRDPKYPYDSLEDLELPGRIRNLPSTRQRQGRASLARPRPRLKTEPDLHHLNEQQDDMEKRNFTYIPARHESQWLLDSLGGFFDQQWFDDILRQIKGGKEATVYQCSAPASFSAPFIAAKVYRPRRFRNLKKDHVYREGRFQLDGDGRQINDSGMLHAMRKRTQYGLELLHTSWLAHEYRALQVLHAAGVDVPEPYASDDNAILMEYIGDAEVPAPALNNIELPRGEARQLFERMLENIDKMLANHYVHGDLSAYNILYHAGRITIIDFPQSIDPEVNRSSYPIFLRDIMRVCDYFSAYGLRLNPPKMAAELWSAHRYHFQPEEDLSMLEDQAEMDVDQ